MALLSENTLIKVILVLLLTTIIACSEQQEGSENETEANSTTQQQSDPVLVRVNNTEITSNDLSIVIDRTLGAAASVSMNAELRNKLLESMVQSRTMALLSEKEIDADDLATIESKTKLYREELLVKEYLQRHIAAQPVTQEMVEAYYRDNLQRFGVIESKTFEYITSTAEMDSDKRNSLLKRLSNATFESDWKTFVGSLKEDGYPLRYQRATIKIDLLNAPLKQLVSQTPKGGISPVKFGRVLYLVRVLDVNTTEPKPLAEVSVDIRKSLAHLQMKKAVKEASAQAQNNVVIERLR